MSPINTFLGVLFIVGIAGPADVWYAERPGRLHILDAPGRQRLATVELERDAVIQREPRAFARHIAADLAETIRLKDDPGRYGAPRAMGGGVFRRTGVGVFRREVSMRTLAMFVLLIVPAVVSRATVAQSPVEFARADLKIQGAAPWAASIGDFNADRLPDIAISNRESKNITVMTAKLGAISERFKPLFAVPKHVAIQMVGDSSRMVLGYTVAGRIDTAAHNQGLRLGDFNLDGIQDLAIANVGTAAAEGRTITVVLGQGSGVFGAPKKYQVGTHPTSVSVADVNTDRHDDVIVTNRDSKSVQVLLGDGRGDFKPVPPVSVSGGPRWSAVGDLNKDGALDIVTANWTSNTVSVLTGKGDGTFDSPRDFAVGRGPSACAIADLDGDSIPDLVVANCGCSTGLPDNTISILKGRGDGTFAPQVTYEVGMGPSAIAVADLNRDGRLDLGITNWGTYARPGNTVSLLLGADGGALRKAGTALVGSAPTAIEVADVNSDFRPDLIVVNNMSDSVTFLLNRLPVIK
jgi:hypothetical protein